jgi:hypothetical protein
MPAFDGGLGQAARLEKPGAPQPLVNAQISAGPAARLAVVVPIVVVLLPHAPIIGRL